MSCSHASAYDICTRTTCTRAACTRASCARVALTHATRSPPNCVGSIGRVVIDLGALASQTLYDCWLPLSYRTLDPPGGRGAIRLRYSVSCCAKRTWLPMHTCMPHVHLQVCYRAERTRLLKYITLRTPTHYIPFSSMRAREQANFVQHGKRCVRA